MKTIHYVAISILCATFTFGAKAQVAPTNGLVAYYPFYGSSTNAYGTGGTVNGSTISLTTNFLGASNSAVHFGGGSYISVSPTPLNVNSNWTILFWLAMDQGVTGANNIISTGQDNQGGVNVRWGGTGPWQIVANWNGSSTNSGVAANATNNSYAWNFVTCLKNGSNYEIFLNSTMIGSNATPGTSLDSGSMWFGQHQSFASYSLRGSMSDVFLYNRALSSNEIQQLYQFEVSPGSPNILTQPQSLTVNAYSTASFTVGATGQQPMSYQWQFNGTNLIGASSSLLKVTNIAPTNLGSYSVIVSNSIGTVVSSNAVLSMYPTIHVPFTGGVVYTGAPDTMSVQVWGSGPLAYQWYDNGVAISGATNSAYTLANPNFNNSGGYTVVVSSPYGSVTNATEQIVVELAGVSLGLFPGVSVTGLVGNTYVIQSTTNLNNPNSWTNAATMTLEYPTEIWVDINQNTTGPGNKQKFYRVAPGQ